METKKAWYQSLTVQSAIVILIVSFKQFFDIVIAQDEIQNILINADEAYISITTLLVSFVTIYGRIRATKKIK